jgi:hypothetical protein
VGLCEFSCPPYLDKVKQYELVGQTNAMLYCDLSTQQFVGSDYVRCLRTFKHCTKYCNYAFQNIYYVPVEKRTFRDIRILITILMEKNITFESGEMPVKLVLHFRRV